MKLNSKIFFIIGSVVFFTIGGYLLTRIPKKELYVNLLTPYIAYLNNPSQEINCSSFDQFQKQLAESRKETPQVEISRSIITNNYYLVLWIDGWCIYYDLGKNEYSFSSEGLKKKHVYMQTAVLLLIGLAMLIMGIKSKPEKESHIIGE